jgi:hypothetical protein
VKSLLSRGSKQRLNAVVAAYSQGMTSQPASQPACETASQPASQPASQIVTKPASETVTEQVREPKFEKD